MPNAKALEPIVLALIERQGTMSSEKFARLIGVTPAYWSNIKAGKRGAGRKFLDGALRTFPDLAYLYVRELTISNERVTQLYG